MSRRRVIRKNKWFRVTTAELRVLMTCVYVRLEATGVHEWTYSRACHCGLTVLSAVCDFHIVFLCFLYIVDQKHTAAQLKKPCDLQHLYCKVYKVPNQGNGMAWKQATTELSIHCIKSYWSLPMRLQFSSTYSVSHLESRTMILSLGVTYSMRDIMSDVNYRAWGAMVRVSHICNWRHPSMNHDHVTYVNGLVVHRPININIDLVCAVVQYPYFSS